MGIQGIWLVRWKQLSRRGTQARDSITLLRTFLFICLPDKKNSFQVQHCVGETWRLIKMTFRPTCYDLVWRKGGLSWNLLELSTFPFLDNDNLPRREVVVNGWCIRNVPATMKDAITAKMNSTRGSCHTIAESRLHCQQGVLRLSLQYGMSDTANLEPLLNWYKQQVWEQLSHEQWTIQKWLDCFHIPRKSSCPWRLGDLGVGDLLDLGESSMPSNHRRHYQKRSPSLYTY